MLHVALFQAGRVARSCEYLSRILMGTGNVAGWHPGLALEVGPAQRVDLETAIRAYTLNGAYANFAEENRGSIEAGKYADLVLLSSDLFEIPVEQIKDAHVVMTMVGGKIIHKEF